ncbi:TPA: trypsin-like peptidase domain-containing protein [Staphylococcus aureus]|uniref:Serine protease n=1 Tax=Staphylococcus aureus TaxID=1280 RepID=A0A1W5T8T3_STAAU|nr:trypsin-like peptidase domain-containing protein [Staphylococcus aureus]ARF19402.1 exfoliative toxin B [Staphylococcus aureus]MBL0430630.1 trypsin-like peptidase domain-containing protein [Staphylococcus aureus]HDH0858030.1 trypsin-like peptidase domain-containing protein [Staphylococcus aureus]HDH5694724.1 trypsin-like peptidase domain-containing protein [Staphylococcus aureus]HDH5697455.1 trypsin-like peptidase domain-containing protein [Staphylococcus aureus]
MDKSFFKKIIFAASVFTVCLPVFPFESTLQAKEYDEEEIMRLKEKFKVPPTDKELYTHITDNTRSPYNSVGTVFVKGKTLATGVLIGKNTIITNYHISRQADKNPSNIIFTPAQNRDIEKHEFPTPYGKFEAEEIKEYPYGQGTDLSIIKLKPNEKGESAGDLVQPAKIPDSIDIQSGDRYVLLGYPYNYSSYSLYQSLIEIFNDIQYFGYTEPGNSGSGIFNLNGELIGIHSGKGGKYGLPLGVFFNRTISSLYSVDNTVGDTLGNDLKKRAKLDE